MPIASERDREFRCCEICGWVCLCHGIKRGSTQQPQVDLERVPDKIWLCAECFERGEQLWQRKAGNGGSDSPAG